uniref:Uncharacterized protein n=1 Tax=Rhizophora mucronata TaxID=61149 RepID=A0A2P2N7Z4_RHIMU
MLDHIILWLLHHFAGTCFLVLILQNSSHFLPFLFPFTPNFCACPVFMD